MANAGTVETRDPSVLRHEFERFREQEIDQRFAALGAAVKPLDVWIDSFDDLLAPPLEAVQQLQSIAAKVLPLILVVDDDDLQREVLSQLLSEVGAELMFAKGGTEALRAAHRHPPDVVLMDVNLPDMNGIEATPRLRETIHGRDTPVIMITGHSHKDIVVESRRAGAVDFVVKPYDPQLLLGKINAFLRR